MAGRPRSPTKILELRGAFKKNPNRQRVDPKSTGPIGAAPRHLTKKQQAIWREIKSQAPVGVLTNADRLALEELCVLVDIRRRGEAAVADRRLLQAYLGRFGMTPSDRAKIAGPPPPKKNPFEGL